MKPFYFQNLFSQNPKLCLRQALSALRTAMPVSTLTKWSAIMNKSKIKINQQTTDYKQQTTYTLCALLLALCLLTFTSTTSATIRYVSPTGNNIPPYLTWEDAANSIQDCINVSVFGDTIYVANGVYQEQVIMIPGLSLIGAGMDSCIIDTRNLVTSQNYNSVIIADSCLLTGFHIYIYHTSLWGRVNAAVSGGTGNNTFTHNMVSNASVGIVTGLNSFIYKNIFNNVSTGGEINNSNAVFRNNTVFTDPNSQATLIAGVDVTGFNSDYIPIIDSNYIQTNKFGTRGIDKGFGSSPIIKNNIIIMKRGERGIFAGASDSTMIFNNLIYAESGVEGIRSTSIPFLKVYNNYVSGNLGTGIFVSPEPNDVKNNIVTHTNTGITKGGTQPNPLIQYNNVWNTSTINYYNFTPDSTNLSVDPMIVNDDTTQGDLDFHLQMFSPMIDAGDPNIFDKDGSRSDIGLYGGPFGESYKYFDLPPRPPRNLTGILSDSTVTTKWNPNTEADFNHYKLFRDTIADFTVDSTTFVLSLTDTFYTHIYPPYAKAYYYKLTALDNQGNESEPSEELGVLITSVQSDEPGVVSNYILYQNYPNPFNPSTKIAYKLKEGGYVKLYVYDIKGELITTLVNQHQSGGYYEVEFSASSIKNPESSIIELASGIYIYQIMVRGENSNPVFSDIKKMVYVK